MQLLQKQETFCGLFFAFLKSILNFEQFRKKMAVIAYAFLHLQTPKSVLR